MILGPTGVGKTNRSISLARQKSVPVISLDRFQIFDELATGTGRPTPEELAGTERIFLARRRVAEGEFPADEAYQALLGWVDALSHHHELILEGGSILLCSTLFEQGFLSAHQVEIQNLTIRDVDFHRNTVKSRIREMLVSTDGRPSMVEELARVWNEPAQLSFLETITGYDIIIEHCRRLRMTPGDVAAQPVAADLVDAIAESHVDYSLRQIAAFARLLSDHTSRWKVQYISEYTRPNASVAHESSRGTASVEESSKTPSDSQFDLSSPARLDDPYSLYARLRREAPVFHDAALDAWIISRYDDVCSILKDPVRFSSIGVLKVKAEPPPEVAAVLAQGIPYVRTLIDNDPPGHTRFRNLVNRAFVPQRVNQLEPKIYASANALIDEIVDSGECDLMERFAFPLPIFVIAEILGLPRTDVGDLKRWCDDWMALQSGTAPVEHLVQCAHSYLAMQQYFLQKVAERTHEPQDDMLSALIQARVDDDAPLATGELVRLLMSLLVAGHETTTHSIGNVLTLLLRNPTQLALLRSNPSLTAQAVEEGLRMDAPVQSLFRRVTEDTTVGGTSLPKGARVMILYGSANRDEAQFKDPDRFDVARGSGGKHLAFSRGIHFCLGATLARMEIRIALDLLIQRLPELQLDESLPLERVPHFFLRGYKRLPLKWNPNPQSAGYPSGVFGKFVNTSESALADSSTLEPKKTASHD
ncbi:MAG: cytochrome P450 [Myxococcales bacterium]